MFETTTPTEPAFQALVHEDHACLHIKDTGWSPNWAAGWIPQGIRLHPDRLEGDWDLPKIPSAPGPYFCQHREGIRQRWNEHHSVCAHQPRNTLILPKNTSRHLRWMQDDCSALSPLLYHSHWKGMRQGDTVSPKLSLAALQWTLKSLDSDEKGITIDRRFLSRLRNCKVLNSLRRVPCMSDEHGERCEKTSG